MPGILFPLVIGAFGLVASIIGSHVGAHREDGDPMHALNRGFYLTAVLGFDRLRLACRWLLGSPLQPAPDAWWHFLHLRRHRHC